MVSVDVRVRVCARTCACAHVQYMVVCMGEYGTGSAGGTAEV